MLLSELADKLDAQLVLKGVEAKTPIKGISTLQTASEGDISFLANPNYRRFLKETRASAVILSEKDVASCPVAALQVPDPYLAYAKASQLFPARPVWQPGIDVTAQVSSSALVASSAWIGPGAVISADAMIEASVFIGANVFIGERVTVGEGTRIDANAVVAHDVVIGRHCHLQSLSIVGGDGFGFARHAQGWMPIAQLGGVVLGDRVHVGASSSIDRGALGDTLIRDDVIIDNQVQVAHNCHIGARTAIAGCVGIAGSTYIGEDCTIAGQAGIAGHLTIADQVHIGMQAQVTRSISESGAYASGTGLYPQSVWRRLVGSWRRLAKSKQQTA